MILHFFHSIAEFQRPVPRTISVSRRPYRTALRKQPRHRRIILDPVHDLPAETAIFRDLGNPDRVASENRLHGIELHTPCSSACCRDSLAVVGLGALYARSE
jgi:hypothetical protein